ncbi:hypothetical protein PHISP_01999 [Aspergillus sp. HF37]|nr:hypothetical protein PHISP_01999 [Aspergillus sp. HF37]
MAYYNITASTEFGPAMYENEAWYSEYQRVCQVDPGALPTSGFNTSIQLSTFNRPSVPTSTPASTGASPTLSSTAQATPTTTGGISPNGLCGASNHGYTCLGSQFGDCCSKYGRCGSADAYCASENCDPEYGDCSSTPGTNISPNGLCGASNNGYTCLGSQFGGCCSKYGSCGSSDDYCGSGNCDADYGTCA